MTPTTGGDSTGGGNEASLSARPGTPTGERFPPGERRLGDAAAGGEVYLPPGIEAGVAVPLVVMFHGAGGSSAQSLDLVRTAAVEHRFVVLAPQSTGPTWDVIAGGWGPDVRRVDEALEAVFDRVAVDPARVVAAGFSDGASYALSVGLANGDLFSDIAAFSPGFAAPPARRGAPRIFVSHGIDDRVLPIDRTSRRLVPSLRAAGYEVRTVEFDGGHGVPPEALELAFQGLAR